MKTNFRLFILVFVIALALTGCATVEKDTRIDHERLLAASGFQLRLADTPEKLEKIKAAPQRKLFPHERNGKTYYIYADATGCECIYVGTEAAYKRVKDLAELKDLKVQTSPGREDVIKDWEVWGGEPGEAWQYSNQKNLNGYNVAG